MIADRVMNKKLRALGVERSGKWPRVRREFLKLHPVCACCGRKTGLEVHHVVPFHLCILLGRPDLELDARNLMTLCETDQHHLLVGHLGSFDSYAPYVARDVRTFRGMTWAQIKADSRWKKRMAKRPKPWEKMTGADKSRLRDRVRRRFPLLGVVVTSKIQSMALSIIESGGN